MFDADSNWTLDAWYHSKACDIMSWCPYTHTEFVHEADMTKGEKECHPEYKTIHGYVKTEIVTDSDKQKWWDELSDVYKQIIYALPNFNKEKFEECVGIKIHDI